MKINSPVSYSVWYLCARYFLYLLTLVSALFIDVACFYTSTFLLAPVSVCLYACALTYASASLVCATLLGIVFSPIIIPVSWVLCMVPIFCMTMIGLCARSVLFTLWPVPYCLVALYVAVICFCVSAQVVF